MPRGNDSSLTIIERVAKAIAITIAYPHERFDPARAALEAIAEPTPEMITIGALAAGKHFMFDEKFEGKFTDRFIEHVWHAMIDAALKETK